LLNPLSETDSTFTAVSPKNQLLWVHGWWGGPWVWQRFEPYFSSRGFDCHVMSFDRNGEAHGDPSGETFAWRYQQLLQRVRSLNHPVVIGHSAGGLLVQKLVEEVDLPAAILLGSAAPRGIFPVRTCTLLLAAIRNAPTILMRRPFLPSRKDMCSLNLNCLQPSEQDWVYDRMVPVAPREAFEVIFSGVPVDASRVHTPMLVVNGGRDRLTPPGVGRAIGRKYDAEYVEYPDHAHYLMWEREWELIAADIERWLNRIRKS
jgi:pimeloyl-ACP methyl ester carboxylesterase